MPTYWKLTDYEDSEDWIQYIETNKRMESYFNANEITAADKQQDILLLEKDL
jgi:hypothetical protein